MNTSGPAELTRQRRGSSSGCQLGNQSLMRTGTLENQIIFSEFDYNPNSISLEQYAPLNVLDDLMKFIKSAKELGVSFISIHTS